MKNFANIRIVKGNNIDDAVNSLQNGEFNESHELCDKIVELSQVKIIDNTKQDYLLSEKGSDIVFAVISQVNGLASLSNTELINKVGQAIEDEFGYEERVKVLHDSFSETGITLYMSFKCIADGDEEEIREVELNLTAIY